MENKQVEKEIILEYTCPAFPPEGINITDNVLFGKDSNGTYIVINGAKKYENIDFIKTYYTPQNNKWENKKQNRE